MTSDKERREVAARVAAHHGEPREENYDVFISLIALAIQLALLTWGGFF